MDFRNRIAKEMTQGMVRAIFEDAGYRVIGTGIEDVLRELICLHRDEYHDLKFPDSMRLLPDMTVMDRDQKERYLIEVKYRGREWPGNIFEKAKDQAKIFGEIFIISFWGCAETKYENLSGPSRYLRCAKVRFQKGICEVELQSKAGIASSTWESLKIINGQKPVDLWYRLPKLQDKFPLLSKRKEDNTLMAAVNALSGILGDHREIKSKAA